ncbi:preprotein translocase subunit SecG [Aurantivibrio plasticivorans]
METLVIVVHVIAAAAIIGLILLQQGKGASMGASFGAGASQTVFGSQGSGNFFSRMTAMVAVVFFSTSFALAVIAKNAGEVSDDLGIPGLNIEESVVPADEDAVESTVPAATEVESAVPTVEEAESAVPVVEDTEVESEVPAAE